MIGIRTRARWEAYRSARMPFKFGVYLVIERAMLVMAIAPFAVYYFYKIDIFGNCLIGLVILTLIHYLRLVLIKPWLAISAMVISALICASIMIFGFDVFNIGLWIVCSCFIFADRCEGEIRLQSARAVDAVRDN